MPVFVVPKTGTIRHKSASAADKGIGGLFIR